MNRGLVLLADDDADDRMLFADAFSQCTSELQLLMVPNGQEVMDYLQNITNSLPCLVVLDYNMPFMSGLDVLKKLNKQNRFATMPIVMLSTSSQIAAECLNDGAKYCFVKPTTFEELLSTTKKILEFSVNFCHPAKSVRETLATNFATFTR